MPPTTADTAGRPAVRPSLLWLLLAPVALVAGVGGAAALVLVTLGGVLDQALSFGPAEDLPAGEVTVWVAETDPPADVRLLGPAGVEVPLTADPAPRTVSADGLRWTAGYTGTVASPGPHHVEATGGQAALRTSPDLDTGSVRSRVLTWPLALAVTGVTISLLVCVTVPLLRALNRHRTG